MFGIDFSNPNTQQIMGGVIRAAMVAAGMGGVLSDNQMGIVAGAISALFAVAWSVLQKNKSVSHDTLAAAVQAAAANPANADAIIAQAKAGKF